MRLKQPFLSRRHQLIIDTLGDQRWWGTPELLAALNDKGEDVSPITLTRTLKLLLQNDFVQKRGQARATQYRLSLTYNTIRPVEVDAYYRRDVDDRVVNERFNFEIFDLLKAEIFNNGAAASAIVAP
jgi:hypothetical protein